MNSPVARRFRCSVPLPLTWSHAGVAYRVAPWPQVQFERSYGDTWAACRPDVHALQAANASAGAWRAYLEFVPADVREFVALFRHTRLSALYVAARCPDLVGALLETPALTGFVAAHPALRECGMERWNELNAVYERGGVFALLEWLGLPATKATLAILRNLVAANLAPALLAAVRAQLWQPQGVFALAQSAVVTERDLATACALAA